MSAVQAKEVTSVKNWDKNLEVTNEPYAQHKLPLAGFSVTEAENVKEVIGLVSNSPCARVKGVIEIWPFWDLTAMAHNNRVEFDVINVSAFTRVSPETLFLLPPEIKGTYKLSSQVVNRLR